MSAETVIARTLYHEASATVYMRDMPRFGRSSSFADLFGSQEEAKGYIVGLLFAGLFLFSIFFAWSVALLIFKCLGQKRVGFLSGNAFVKPTNSTQRCDRPFICRLVFLNAYIFFIIFSVLFVTQGLTNLRTTINTVVQSARDIRAVSAEVNGIMADLDSIGENATEVRATFFSELDSGGTECLINETLQNETQINFEELLESIRTSLTDMENFQPSQSDNLLNTTEFIADSANTVANEGENIQLGDWQSLIIIIPYIIVPSILMIGVCVAWFEFDVPRLRCFISWFVLPLFVILVVAAYVLSCLIMIASSANADFCSGGQEHIPDRTVEEILVKLGYSQDDQLFQIVLWYIGQCANPDGDVLEFLANFQSIAFTVKEDLISFTLALQQAGSAAISDLCSTEIQVLNGLAAVLELNLEILYSALVRTLSLLKCSNLISLYTNPVYNGTCTYSITGVVWAFSAFAVVATMGMIMIMLRSVWQVDVTDGIKMIPKVEEEQDDYGGYTGYEGGNDFDEAKDIGEDSSSQPDRDATDLEESAQEESPLGENLQENQLTRQPSKSLYVGRFDEGQFGDENYNDGQQGLGHPSGGLL